jgi:transposase
MARPEFASDVTREQFESVRGMLEAARKKTRPRKHDLYDVFCAVLYLLDRGSTWRNVPPEFPPWRTVHEYFTQWTLMREGGKTLLERALERLGRQTAVDRLHQLLAPR